MKQVFEDSEIVGKKSAGRTRMSAIVNNVLAPFSHELVLKDLKNDIPFSIATDASNKGNRKFFPVGVQYFIPEQGISFRILDFYEDAFEDSQSVRNQLCRVIMDNNLSRMYVSAYGADNASVNYGVSNSVFQKYANKKIKILLLLTAIIISSITVQSML
jgi:hypothetical protein